MNQKYCLLLQKAAIAALVYLILRYVLPLIFPFFFAWLTVYVLNRIRHRFSMRLVPLSAGVLCLLCLVALCSLLLGGYLLYPPVMELLPVCLNYLKSLPFLSNWIPASMPSVFSCFLGIFLYFMSIILFAKDWKAFENILIQIPFYLMFQNAGKRMAHACRSWIYAQFRIMFIITLECALGFWLLLKLPGAGLWAVLTGLLDALPVFGTGTVFLPWLLIELLRQNWMFSLKLFILYAITWLTREFVEPKFLGDGLGLLPVCFLISVIVGMKLFGPWGLFTGPFGVILTKELWAELENPASLQTPSVPLSADDETKS